MNIETLNIALLDGPAAGQVIENVPAHALNIETAEYALVPKYVLRFHHYSMDGRYLSTEDAPPYDDDHEKCRYRDEVVELTKQVNRLEKRIARFAEWEAAWQEASKML